MIKTPADSLCVYTQLENGIHEFLFTNTSRAAIDAYFEQVAIVFQDVSSGETIRLLMDCRQSGIPPMNYMSQKARDFLQHHPHIPHARHAIVHNPGTLVGLAQTMVNLVQANTSVRRLFKEDQYEDAVAWLLEG